MAIAQLTPAEAHAILSENTSAVYLDVRTEAEFQAGHPEGAINIPVVFFGLVGRRPKPNPDFLAVVEATLAKQTTVVLGCQAGVRSQHAAEIMERAGYTDVSNMLGGFGGGQDEFGRTVVGWRDAGLPANTGDDGENSYAALSEKTGRKG